VDFDRLSQCIDGLKKMVRSGWMMRGIPPLLGDTVAGHAFEAAVIGLHLASLLVSRGVKVYPDKVAAMAILHDLPECVVGDIPKNAKEALRGAEKGVETAAVHGLLGEGYMLGLYEEYAELQSLESRIAHIADKLSTYIEAKRLEKLGYKRASEISASSLAAIKQILESFSQEERRVIEDALAETFGETLRDSC